MLMHISTTSVPSREERNMRFPQTMGVEPEPDLPGKGGRVYFQAMFLVSLHSTGRLVSLHMPLLSGPRHPGQFSPQTVVAIAQRTSAKARRKRIVLRVMASNGFAKGNCGRGIGDSDSPALDRAL